MAKQDGNFDRWWRKLMGEQLGRPGKRRDARRRRPDRRKAKRRRLMARQSRRYNRGQRRGQHDKSRRR